ncbi:MAG: HAMP domain-containing sensor histidine kinase [Candidatus Paceibacterota bacterium]
MLFYIGLIFSLWTLANLIVWTNIHSDFILFVWSYFGILSSLLSVFCVYFIYAFLKKGDVSLGHKLVFLTLLAPVFILASTSMNLGGFDLIACDAFAYENLAFYTYYTMLGVLAMVWIFWLLARAYRSAAPDFKKQIVLMGIGMEFFLFSFFIIIFFSSYLTGAGFLESSEAEFYAFFGMIIFMSFIAYMIVRFKTFNVGLVASQALVIALVILIGSQFTYVRSTTSVVLSSITLVLTIVAGYILVRSVKREIEQREVVESLAKTLDETNGRQETLIHFIGHEVKGFLTKDTGAFSSLMDGDFGPLPEPLKPFVTRALLESRAGADSVAQILKASNLKKGTVTYAKEPFDLKDLVAKAVEKGKLSAEQKGVTLSFSAAEGSYTMVGDAPQLADHVLRNLIDNAINYTPAGTIAVTLKNESGKLVFAVKDSGIGITEADKKRLFTEGGHGENSQKVNAHSTGYGLYIAKNITEAHGGTIRAESEGEGKGSTFIAEFPASDVPDGNKHAA